MTATIIVKDVVRATIAIVDSSCLNRDRNCASPDRLVADCTMATRIRSKELLDPRIQAQANALLTDVFLFYTKERTHLKASAKQTNKVKMRKRKKRRRF